MAQSKTPITTELREELDTQEYEKIDETIASPSIGGGSEITNVSNLNFFGSRVGEVYTLGISFNFDMSVGNRFDQITIDMSQFSFWNSLKNIEKVGGSAASNVNTTVSPGAAVSIAIGKSLANNSTIYINFSGNFQSSSSRILDGNLVITVGD